MLWPNPIWSRLIIDEIIAVFAGIGKNTKCDKSLFWNSFLYTNKITINFTLTQ